VTGTAWLVTGARGQLGLDLQAALAVRGEDAVTAVGRAELDLTDEAQVRSVLRGWLAAAEASGRRPVVLNAAAYTAVDDAEEHEAEALVVNGAAPGWIAEELAGRGRMVHVSTDYVFDGTREEHPEDEPFSPLGVYGQSKAAGDLAVATTPRHYVVRTSWVIGDGGNFVRTMARLAGDGVSPSVVADQVGRLTFTDTLAAAIAHLVATEAPYGTYNVTNAGAPMSWQQVAAAVFELSGRSASDVAATTTEAYFASAVAAGRPVSPRPLRSVLPLDRLTATGFTPEDQLVALRRYLG